MQCLQWFILVWISNKGPKPEKEFLYLSAANKKKYFFLHFIISWSWNTNNNTYNQVTKIYNLDGLQRKDATTLLKFEEQDHSEGILIAQCFKRLWVNCRHTTRTFCMEVISRLHIFNQLMLILWLGWSVCLYVCTVWCNQIGTVCKLTLFERL